MSNVHGFGEFGNQSNNRSNLPPIRNNNYNRQSVDDNDNGFFSAVREPVLEEQLRIANQHRVLFISGRTSLKDPRQQNFWDMLAFSLCPTFKFLSLTFVIIVADIGMFIWEEIRGLDKTSNNLLMVNSQTLVDLGANYQPYLLLYKQQFYRYLSAIFLHIHFLHIFGNLITTFMFLSRIEYTYGVGKTLVIYLLSGIGGNIFSALVSPSGVKAGASTALYGIIGVIIGYIVINWNGLDLVGQQMKCQIFCSGFMVIIFIFIFTPTSSNSSIDYMGHLGGFLSGLWLSGIHDTIINQKRQKIFRVTFISLYIIQQLTCFLVFYLTQKPYFG